MQSTLRDILSAAAFHNSTKAAQILMETNSAAPTTATTTSGGQAAEFAFKLPSPNDGTNHDRDNNNDHQSSHYAIDLSSPPPAHSSRDNHSHNGSTHGRQSVIRSSNGNSGGLVSLKKHAVAAYNMQHSPQNGSKASPRMSGECDMLFLLFFMVIAREHNSHETRSVSLFSTLFLC